MRQIIAIAMGGSIGAVVRFVMANGIYAVLGRSFPHGTLVVNVSGSFLMGILSELLLQRFPLSVEYRAAILVGFLGAYTTFSTFAFETLMLFEEGSLVKAGLNIFLSVVLCLVAVWLGLVWGRALFSGGVLPWLNQGFPQFHLGLGLLSLFVLALLGEWMSQRHGLDPLYRSLFLMIVLGTATLLLSVWSMWTPGGVRYELPDMLGIFVVNALFGAACVWLGTTMGAWLWQNEQ